MIEGLHVGRSWADTHLEDECPCPKEPCGLVDLAKASPECDQHPAERSKTLRQIHEARLCPGRKI